jgi:uracil-DNA glycosylase family 4
VPPGYICTLFQLPVMPSDFDDIRAALEHQMALYGDLVLVDDAVSPALEPAPARSQPAPEPAPVSVSDAVSDPYARIAALIPADSPLHAMSSLEEVSAWVAGTELIDLDRTRKNPVFGVGHAEADLMVIGEAPGADEDEQGEPFVGRAGKLLTDILGAIGFERSDVYIANILKSRPPNNRDPLPDEVAAHIPILHKQIALIQPRLILCVGRTSGTSLLGRDSSLKDMRGIFHDYHGIEVMVTYHPAALLRNPNWKRPTWEDVQLLRRRYDELTA